MRTRRIVCAAHLVAALSIAGAAGAQEPEAAPRRLYVGGQPLYARTVGEFRDYVDDGGGANFHIVFPMRPGGAFALRADAGFIVYGSETKDVCFSSTAGCRIELDLTTTNSIAFLNLGPQLMLPAGPLRPYVNAAVGLAYFATNSNVRGSNQGTGGGSFANTNNFDDVTLAWAAGAGTLIRLGGTRVPVLLDLAARYHANGRAEYLKKGDIRDQPDGSITFTPTRSQANLVTFQLGVTVNAPLR